jgi:hypothetical protein
MQSGVTVIGVASEREIASDNGDYGIQRSKCQEKKEPGMAPVFLL